MNHIHHLKSFVFSAWVIAAAILISPTIVSAQHATPLAIQQPAHQSTSSGLTPIAPNVRAALDAVRSDPPPENLIQDRHYIRSNEYRLDLYEKLIRDKGGMYIGVGSDQNYLFAGWSKPEILVLFDFDQYIVDLHQVYRVLFLSAKTPEEFLSMWSLSREKEVLRLLAKTASTDKWKARSKLIYTRVRKTVYGQLQRHVRMAKELNIGTFVTDPAQYRYIVELFENDRVLAIRGDLTEQRTMNDLAEVSVRFDIPIRILYLSNCEYYFKYREKHFRENMLGLNFDRHSLVLHTDPKNSDEYRYYYQGGQNFQAWLRCRCVGNFRGMAGFARKLDEPDFRVIGALPTDFESLRQRMKLTAYK